MTKPIDDTSYYKRNTSHIKSFQDKNGSYTSNASHHIHPHNQKNPGIGNQSFSDIDNKNSSNKKKRIKNHPKKVSPLIKFVAATLVTGILLTGVSHLYEKFSNKDDIIITEKANDIPLVKEVEQDIMEYFEEKQANSYFLLSLGEIYPEYIKSIIKNIPYLDNLIHDHGYTPKMLKCILAMTGEAPELLSEISNDEWRTFLPIISPYVKDKKISMADPTALASKLISNRIHFSETEEAFITSSDSVIDVYLNLLSNSSLEKSDAALAYNALRTDVFLRDLSSKSSSAILQYTENSITNKGILNDLSLYPSSDSPFSANTFSDNTISVYIDYCDKVADTRNDIVNGTIFSDLKSSAPGNYALLVASAERFSQEPTDDPYLAKKRSSSYSIAALMNSPNNAASKDAFQNYVQCSNTVYENFLTAVNDPTNESITAAQEDYNKSQEELNNKASSLPNLLSSVTKLCEDFKDKRTFDREIDISQR